MEYTFASELGKLAAEMKKSVSVRRGRAGRITKGMQMTKQLHAAGQPKMNTPGVFGYPRGQSV